MFSRSIIALFAFFEIYYPPILFPSFYNICIFPYFVFKYIFLQKRENRTKIEHYFERRGETYL